MTRSAKERKELLLEISRRRSAEEPFIRRVVIPPEVGDSDLEHAAGIAAVQTLREPLQLAPAVTFFVGENGSGKSTIVEAIAVSAGMNAEGGSRHLQLSTRASHSPLGDQLRLTRSSRRPETEFFLRAESVFTFATKLDELVADAQTPHDKERIREQYGVDSLHEVSHGESFLGIVMNRFGPDGFYVLDEPESALSVHNQLTLLRRIRDLVRQGCQFVIATHSPILLAYPGASILLCDSNGLREVSYDEAPPVAATRRFLEQPSNTVEILFADADD